MKTLFTLLILIMTIGTANAQGGPGPAPPKFDKPHPDGALTKYLYDEQGVFKNSIIVMPGANWSPPEGMVLSDTPPPQPQEPKVKRKIREFISDPNKDIHGRSKNPTPVGPIIECGDEATPCPTETTLPDDHFYTSVNADGTILRRNKAKEICLAKGRTEEECKPLEDRLKELEAKTKNIK